MAAVPMETFAGMAWFSVASGAGTPESPFVLAVSGTGGITGSGTSGQLTYWTGAAAVGSTARITYLDTLPGNSTTANFLNVTGTLPAVPTVLVNAVNLQITGAGSASIIQRGFNLNLLVGYTGSSSTVAGSFTNASAGTSATWYATGGNIGFTTSSQGTTAGANVGNSGTATGSSLANVAMIGRAVSATNSPPLNIGYYGVALNATTNIGGLFTLYGATAPTTLNQSAALIADCAATASPIFLGMAAGTIVTTVASTGAATLTTNSVNATPLTIKGLNGQISPLLNATDVNGVAYVTVGPPVLPGNSSTINFLNVTGTLPATVTAGQAIGVELAITTAGSSSFLQRALDAKLLPGYTGSSATAAGTFANTALGTANTLTSGFTGLGNTGINGNALGSTSGSNIGTYSSCVGSSTGNIAIMGRTVSGTNGAVLNLAVVGNSLSATTNIGGFFGLYSGTPTTLTVEAALIADCGATSSPIHIGMKNGVTAYTHDTNGNLVFNIAGLGVQYQSGANQRAGNATMVGGTVTVANTSITANTIVIYARMTAGGTLGNISYTISAGTSFTLNSSTILDTSTFSYVLHEVN